MKPRWYCQDLGGELIEMGEGRAVRSGRNLALLCAFPGPSSIHPIPVPDFINCTGSLALLTLRRGTTSVIFPF